MQTTYARTSNEATQLEEDGRRVARLAARESIVLIENDGALPLKPGRIALFGAGAGMTVSGGTVNIFSAVQVTRSVRELKIGDIAKAELPFFIGYTAVFFLCVFSEKFCTFLVK